jgi:hypothetical protein
MATGDFLWRQLYRNCRAMGADHTLAAEGNGGASGSGWSGPKGGDIQVMEPVQHVMEQSAVQINEDGTVVAQLTLNLPARGRSILAQAANYIFGNVLPQLMQDSLVYESLSANMLAQHVDSVQEQLWLQDQLGAAGLVAFVRNGAILPRVSGAADNDFPMLKGAIPFQSPPNLEVSFLLPLTDITVTGMGIRKGVTLICGGGFHGKSTLLQTLQLGVYSKIPGDGREFCVTSANAMKIRAEDGRCVKSVDISPFINNLPFGKDTKCFSTLDASGSTSQATNIVEVSEQEKQNVLILYALFCYWRSCISGSYCRALYIGVLSLWLRQCVFPPRVITRSDVALFPLLCCILQMRILSFTRYILTLHDLTLNFYWYSLSKWGPTRFWWTKIRKFILLFFEAWNSLVCVAHSFL